MKKFFAILLISLLAAGCTLHEQLTSYTRSDDFYTNAAQCRSGINACYNLIRSQLGGNGFWMATEATTDLMYLNMSTMYNATLRISPSAPGIATTIWQYSYRGVMRANSILAAIDKAVAKGNIEEKEGLQLKGEAVVLRAFFYYLLTCTFGDVPFYTDVVTEHNRKQIASLPRMSANDTRDYLIEELKHYLYPASEGGLEALELKRSYDGVFENRMNAAIGLMLAGKFCLWNERWDDAVDVLGHLEDIYGHYADNPEQFAIDYPITDVPFSRKFVPESILEIENKVEEYGVQLSGGLAMYTTPSKTNNNTVTITEGDEEQEYVMTDVFCGITIPELGTQCRIATSVRPTTYYFETVLSYDSPDIRSGEYSNGATEARQGSGNLAWRWSGWAPDDGERKPENRAVYWFKSGSGSGAGTLSAINRPWLGNKFWCNNMYYTMDSNNYKFFRFADAELMLAEAHLRAGRQAEATKYLNITRVRAKLNKLTPAAMGGNEEALMEEIRLERARELLGEFQRKFDLVRWGIWYERTVQYNDGMYLPDYIQPYHRYLPIPAEQITYSHGALDNNEYTNN